MTDTKLEPSDAEVVFPSDVIHTNDPTGLDIEYCIFHIKEIRFRLSSLAIRFENEHHQHKIALALGHLDLAEGYAKAIRD